MENYRKELLKEFKKERPTYRDMIKFCCDSCVLNNYIVPELSKKDIFFDVYTGSERTFYNADGDGGSNRHIKRTLRHYGSKIKTV